MQRSPTTSKTLSQSPLRRSPLWLAVLALSLSWTGCDDERDPVDSGDEIDGGSRRDGDVTNEDGGGTEDDGGGTEGTCRPAGGECDLIEQDCGDGEACRYVVPAGGTDPQALCEAAGTRVAGEECTRGAGQPPPCAEGLICLQGHCRSYCCDGRTADCDTGEMCVPGGGEPDVGFCIPDDGCNPVDGSGCDEGQACYLVGSGRSCFEEGEGAIGTSCETLSDCVAGHACIGPDAENSFCRKACELEMAGADCPVEGQTCVRLTGVEGVGACCIVDEETGACT